MGQTISKRKLVRLLRRVEGQITENELYELYTLAQRVPANQYIIEIGSYRGKSALCLALGSTSANGVPIYTIDPHLDFRGMNGSVFGPDDMWHKFRNFSKFQESRLINCITLPSNKVAPVWDKPIGLLWIDGDHSYEAVSQDFFGFKKHLVNDAIVAFHDSRMASVTAFLEELVEQKEVQRIRVVDSLAVFQFLGK